METKIESRIGQLNCNDESIYTFISNFNNFKQFVPADKIRDFESTEDSCRFGVPNIGKVGLRIIERDPFKTIKVTGDGMANQQFVLWIQLKQVADLDTRVKVTIKADLNPMLKMMAQKPLQNFVDKLVEAMEKIKFQ
ncbi:MAG: SRPBCC family protein [Bacteroidota bacterium]|nr:SRPBCC family protein [Bacteroidota bacterium]